MSKKYFGTDGIRARANGPKMTAELAMRVAKATTIAVRKAQNNTGTHRVIIGKDTRLSGYMIEEAMCAGFVSMGMEALLVGPIPTPGIAMLTHSMRADIGVMISASHNQYEDNGIKLFGADGYKLPHALEDDIEAHIHDDWNTDLAEPDCIGKAVRLDDALGRYVEHVKSSFPRGETLSGLKVVVDCAHGAAYKVAPRVLWELETDVIAIGDQPNGRNINDGYGATATAKLQESVVDHGADIGLALDGDADRLIVVNERGERVDGDQIMAALAMDMKSRGVLAGNTLVATVMSNMGLEKLCQTNDIHFIRTAVGDRHVVRTMRDKGYNLGGEQSGHIIMGNYGTTGDGLLAGLRVLNLIKQSGKKTSEVLNCFTPYPQALENVSADKAVLNKDSVQDAIDSVKEKLSDTGRILVRPSGTEPLIRVMIEAEDEEVIEPLMREICDVIAKSR